jgi:hypothetical protein
MENAQYKEAMFRMKLGIKQVTRPIGQKMEMIVEEIRLLMNERRE